MYQEGLALNNQQCLICNKTQLNHLTVIETIAILEYKQIIFNSFLK